MKWPREIIAAFCKALDIELDNGTPKEQIIETMLDRATRRAVWRAGGDPTQARAALRSPYTPLGSVTGDGIDGKVKRFTLKGEFWGPAVQAFHGYIEANAAAVFDAFKDEGEPYDDLIG